MDEKNCLDFYRLLSSCGESIWGNISWSIFKPLFSSPLSSKEMKTSVWEKFMSQNLKDRVFKHITKLKEFARSFSTKAALYFSSLWNPVNVISSNKVLSMWLSSPFPLVNSAQSNSRSISLLYMGFVKKCYVVCNFLFSIGLSVWWCSIHALEGQFSPMKPLSDAWG